MANTVQAARTLTSQAIGAIQAACERELRELREAREENEQLRERNAELENEVEDAKKMVEKKARDANEVIEERERQLEKAERREEKMKESRKKYMRRYQEANIAANIRSSCDCLLLRGR